MPSAKRDHTKILKSANDTSVFDRKDFDVSLPKTDSSDLRRHFMKKLLTPTLWEFEL